MGPSADRHSVMAALSLSFLAADHAHYQSLRDMARLPSCYTSAITYVGRVGSQKAQMRETLFVLVSLLDGPLHGYAIIQLAAELSGAGSGWPLARCTLRWIASPLRAL